MFLAWKPTFITIWLHADTVTSIFTVPLDRHGLNKNIINNQINSQSFDTKWDTEGQVI